MILVKLDSAKPENKQLRKDWKVKGAPAFVLLSGDKPAAQWAGYSKPDAWIGKLDKAMKDLPKTKP